MNTTKWICLTLVVLAIVAAMWRCNDAGWLRKKPVIIPGKADTVIVHDTAEQEMVFDKDTVYVPRWREVIDTIIEKTDTARLLAAYYRKYLLQDTVYKSKYGRIVLFDSVTQNSVVKRRIVSSIKFPPQIIKKITIHDTLVRQVPATGRTILYFGGAVLGTPMVGSLSLGVKLPSDLYVGAIAERRWSDVKAVYGIQILLPIKFKRK